MLLLLWLLGCNRWFGLRHHPGPGLALFALEERCQEESDNQYQNREKEVASGLLLIHHTSLHEVGWGTG